MTLEPYYDHERSLYMIPGPVLLEIIATVKRDEREECAKVCENLNGTSSRRCAEAIRARGQE